MAQTKVPRALGAVISSKIQAYVAARTWTTAWANRSVEERRAQYDEYQYWDAVRKRSERELAEMGIVLP